MKKKVMFVAAAMSVGLCGLSLCCDVLNASASAMIEDQDHGIAHFSVKGNSNNPTDPDDPDDPNNPGDKVRGDLALTKSPSFEFGEHPLQPTTSNDPNLQKNENGIATFDIVGSHDVNVKDENGQGSGRIDYGDVLEVNDLRGDANAPKWTVLASTKGFTTKEITIDSTSHVLKQETGGNKLPIVELTMMVDDGVDATNNTTDVKGHAADIANGANIVAEQGDYKVGLVQSGKTQAQISVKTSSLEAKEYWGLIDYTLQSGI